MTTGAGPSWKNMGWIHIFSVFQETQECKNQLTLPKLAAFQPLERLIVQEIILYSATALVTGGQPGTWLT